MNNQRAVSVKEHAGNITRSSSETLERTTLLINPSNCGLVGKIRIITSGGGG